MMIFLISDKMPFQSCCVASNVTVVIFLALSKHICGNYIKGSGIIQTKHLFIMINLEIMQRQLGNDALYRFDMLYYFLCPTNRQDPTQHHI